MNEKTEKKVSFKPTIMDQALMETIGWSEEDIKGFGEDVDEEEMVGTKEEDQKVGTKDDISCEPGVVSPPLIKQTVASAAKSSANKITPEQKARTNKNRM